MIVGIPVSVNRMEKGEKVYITMYDLWVSYPIIRSIRCT